MSEVSFRPIAADTQGLIDLGDVPVGEQKQLTIVMPDGFHGLSDPDDPDSTIMVQIMIDKVLNAEVPRNKAFATHGAKEIEIDFEAICDDQPGGFNILVMGPPPGLESGHYKVEFEAVAVTTAVTDAVPTEPELTGTARIIGHNGFDQDPSVEFWPPRENKPPPTAAEQAAAKQAAAKRMAHGRWRGLLLAGLFLAVPFLMVGAIALAALLFG